ncbi:hypothetical protein F5Y19DRAFT_432715 [Xylariaceae sp. FL1651]|nr:hypothetical protein F5Y19DRAFT_432715 [Xylariaceae sp. FL1651]
MLIIVSLVSLLASSGQSVPIYVWWLPSHADFRSALHYLKTRRQPDSWRSKAYIYIYIWIAVFGGGRPPSSTALSDHCQPSSLGRYITCISNGNNIFFFCVLQPELIPGAG